jgi:hypothetical protein
MARGRVGIFPQPFHDILSVLCLFHLVVEKADITVIVAPLQEICLSYIFYR